MISHEQKVEKFYPHGSVLRSLQDGGFFSFGMWREGTTDYRQAALDLLAMALANEKKPNRGAVLNITYGYDSETFEIYRILSPEKIVTIDVTETHFNARETFLRIVHDVLEVGGAPLLHHSQRGDCPRKCGEVLDRNDNCQEPAYAGGQLDDNRGLVSAYRINGV